MGLKQATYANYEIGKTQPTIETLCKIADFFNVSLDYLCEHEIKNQQDIEFVDDKTMQILQISKNLNDTSKIKAIAYISGLLDGQ